MISVNLSSAEFGNMLAQYGRAYEFDRSIICPWDATADAKRIRQYINYYRIKYSIVSALQPSVIVEIGVRAGYSAWAFMQACPKAVYVGFDASNGKHGGQGPKSYMPWARKLLTELGVDFRLYDGFDTQKVDSLPETGDFYHVDGDHSRAGCWHDMTMCFEALPSGGHLLVDDYSYLKSVSAAVDAWLANNKDRVFVVYIESLRGEVLIRKK